MRCAIVGSLAALLTGAGLALAQPDEILPPPRDASGPSAGAPADQAAVIPVLAPGFGGDPGTAYGPPPPIMAPVCGTLGTPFRLWAEGDYHLWWLKPNRFPALLVSTPVAAPGGPGTEVLVGGDSLDRPQRNGGGLTLGAWFTEYQGFGIEGSFFVMESGARSFTAAGTGVAGLLARPFFDALAGQEAFAAVAAPGLVSGSASGAAIGANCDSGRFAGVGFDFIGSICCNESCRLDFLVGYRYLMLDDRFGMTTNSVATDGLLLANGQLLNSVTDAISTSNRFNGGDIGLRGEWHFNRLLLRATAKVAFGATEEGADLSGVTTSLSRTGVPTVVAGGFLVRPSNGGSLSTEQFAVVPEGGLTLAYQICDWMRVTAGYTFLYWSSVARTGDQVSANINRLEVPSLVTPTGFAAVPAAMIHCSDFWAHGVNVGLELRY
jgi:hypothetical protein